jgi:hypothetical protein
MPQPYRHSRVLLAVPIIKTLFRQESVEKMLVRDDGKGDDLELG